MRVLVSFIVGATFGVGLLISGMTNTNKVQGWLDIFGAWDPTLAFVMGGAIVPMAIAWQLTKTRKPVFADSFPAAPDPRIGRNLVIGSTLFGAGWGLAGLCPGPAVASLSYGGIGGLTFIVAMLLGMLIAPRVRTRLDQMATAS
ncbi:hypothetical protein DS901_11615 [Loktanella sp. D2R18]|uniref:DUF6691 family protein n=1 Tax=Rhodobacterales TaxID=204455 RepID=UPI000DE94090|nr:MULTISPECIES: DUF6691 family protein [Rhodobacterales]MDO6590307.1 hypothetical protein [Yoonia sp. 1_MG-2023]RBW42888.1 hypothetical protein DS901_11615 [Loktanella sp. D2R18]